MSDKIKLLLFPFFLALLFSLPVSAQPNFDLSFESPIVDAADQGRLFEVTQLLQSGISANTKGEFESTALMRAAFNGHLEIVKLLLANGADVHAKDIGGATALHLASRQGNKKIVELLLQAGADTEVADKEGFSPTTRAITNENSRVVKALVDDGAEIDEKGISGATALDVAKEVNNKEIINILKDKEAAEKADAAKQHVELKESPIDSDEQSLYESEVDYPNNVDESDYSDHQQPAASEQMPWITNQSSIITRNQNYNFTPIKSREASSIQVLDQEQDLVSKIRKIQAEKSAPNFTYKQPQKPKSARTSKVKVTEAIKIPDELDISKHKVPSMKHVTVTPSNSAKSTQSGSSKTAVNLAASQDRVIPVQRFATSQTVMEVRGFADTEQAKALQAELRQDKSFSKLNVNIVYDESEKQPLIQVGIFADYRDVFSYCRHVNEKHESLLCYAVNE